MPWRPDCIFEIDQLWQTGFSRVYSNCCCSCSFEPGIIKIGQSSNKMCSNNIVNFQESMTILNACPKMSGNLLNTPHNICSVTPLTLCSGWQEPYNICGTFFTAKCKLVSPMFKDKQNLHRYSRKNSVEKRKILYFGLARKFISTLNFTQSGWLILFSPDLHFRLAKWVSGQTHSLWLETATRTDVPLAVST